MYHTYYQPKPQPQSKEPSFTKKSSFHKVVYQSSHERPPKPCQIKFNQTVLGRINKTNIMTRNAKATSTVKLGTKHFPSLKNLVFPKIGSRSPVRENSRNLEAPQRSPISKVLVPSDF